MLFTVLTPTFNRAHTLDRVYDSLRAQTCRDFEWLVVDDGSTDHTAGLIEEWRREADFPITCIRQSNRGKHVAFNTGVRAARGQLVATLDSDDGCVPHALERLSQTWETIPADERGRFLGVTCTCRLPDGQRYGPPLPRPMFDADARTVYFQFGVRQELWGCARLDVLRAHPFPEDVTGFLPESTLWFRLARAYRTRYIDEPLRVYHQDVPSLMRPAAGVTHAAGGRASALFMLTENLDCFRDAPGVFLREAIQYVRYARHLGEPVRAQWTALRSSAARALVALAYPLGVSIWARDRWRVIRH